MTTSSAPTSHRVVVGVDGSPSSRQALRWAAAQAALTGAELHAVTTWHLPASYDWDGAIDSIDWSGGARRTLESAISDALSEEDAARVVRHLVEGHPARMLVRQAADADLLVIGSRGHGGLAGILVGSVGLHLLAHATCPVVVVHGDRVPSAPTVASRSTQFAHN